MSRPLATRERVAWLRLARTPQVGPLTFMRLIKRFGAAEAALEALPRVSKGRLSPASQDAAERELDGLERIGARLVASCEPSFPSLLAALDPPPPVLAVRGRVELTARPCVALVGAREASAAGLALAEQIARDLGAAGVTVVSGLARGTDAAAHRASLASGTVAVLAGGLDKPYPPQNLPLHDAIVERGLVVSAMPLGWQARAQDFPRRNHIIAGLALGVAVIEAALRSGSLITARAGAEMGREVMAAPGSPLDARARGANALLKDGATLIENADDVLAAIRAAPRPIRAPLLPLFDERTDASQDLIERVARLLSPVPVSVNALARAAEADVAAVAAALVELELEGRALTTPGGQAASSGASESGRT